MFNVPNMADFLKAARTCFADMPFAVQDVCSHFFPVLSQHAFPTNCLMARNEWFPLDIINLRLFGVSFTVYNIHLFCDTTQPNKPAQHLLWSFSFVRQKPSADGIPGAFGFRIDQASKQCPSPASHLLISAGGFCPDPRRTRNNLGSSLPVFHLVGVPFGWQAFVLEGTWHFFSEDEGKYFYLQILFLNNSGFLIHFNSETTGIKHITCLNQIMKNFSFFDHPHFKTRQWKVVCDISRLRPLPWRSSETLAKKLVEVGCFSRFRGWGNLGVSQDNILGVAYREAMNLELELFLNYAFPKGGSFIYFKLLEGFKGGSQMFFNLLDLIPRWYS